MPARDLEASVHEALSTVRDPELDEPITDLEFVQAIVVDGTAVRVELRLPTYFCAPNFAYLMVADAYDAVAGVPGVTATAVVLCDHFAGEEINAGVAAARGFAGSFPGLADDELSDLRLTFQRKAHRACQEQVAVQLLSDGWTLDMLTGATLRDVRSEAHLERLVRRRADIGLPCDQDAPLLLHDDGSAICEQDVPAQLRFAATTRISIEGNAALCRGLLSVRYPLDRRAG